MKAGLALKIRHKMSRFTLDSFFKFKGKLCSPELKL